MRSPPADLLALRRAVDETWGWTYTQRIKQRGARKATPVTRRISQAEYDTLAPTKQTSCRWEPDPALIAKLVEAEHAFTMTFLPQEEATDEKTKKTA